VVRNSAGLRPVVRDITSDVGVAVVMASVVDEWLSGSAASA
jgi:ribosomal protein S12 methylthiotransferase accessory factor YcaO